MIFARKIPEFYTIIACATWGMCDVPLCRPPLPPAVPYAYAENRTTLAEKPSRR